MSTPNVCFFKKSLAALAVALLALLPAHPAMASESPATGPGLEPGYISVIDTSGNAKILTPDQPDGTVPAIGMNLRLGDTVVTGVGGRVGLAFSNGSLFEVSENSRFSVQEFLQEPWKFSVEEWKALENEPTKSRTKVFVEYGELAVKVKKLGPDSSMQVSTPLGVAGIRGTTFRVRVVRNPDGSPRTVTVQLAEGRVDFTPQGGGESTAIAPGNSITVTVNMGEDGTIQISPPVEERLSTEETAAIQESIQRLLENNETLGSFGDSPVQSDDGGDSRPQPAANPPAPPPPPPRPTPTPVPSGL